MLHYHDFNRQLYVNLDVSKEFGFEAHVYYVKNDDPLLRKSSANLFADAINSDDPLLRKSFVAINEVLK